jgi:hypothetical protein
VLKVDFVNRYEDTISFVQSGDWTIRMIGGEYYRYGYTGKFNQHNMVDPSGGPYIAAGSDMGRFLKQWKGLIVSHITVESVTNEKILHLFQGRMMKGKTNEEEELRWYKAGDSSGDFERYNDMEQFLVSKV